MAEPLRAQAPEEPLSELRLEDLERFAQGAIGRPALPLREWIALAEAWRIARALREHRGNRTAAARALGIGRRTLYTKMEKLGVVPSWSVTRALPGTSQAAGDPEADAG